MDALKQRLRSRGGQKREVVVERVLVDLARLLRILEYSSFLSVMFAVVVYFNEAPDRKKQKHYQAWQVINTAQGKGGSGGRIEAMQELNADKIPLVGVDASSQSAPPQSAGIHKPRLCTYWRAAS